MPSPLTFHCPHCRHRYDDALELLAPDLVHDFRCEHCHQHFHVRVRECAPCHAESTFAWRATPAGAHGDALACHACGHPFDGDAADAADGDELSARG